MLTSQQCATIAIGPGLGAVYERRDVLRIGEAGDLLGCGTWAAVGSSCPEKQGTDK